MKFLEIYFLFVNIMGFLAMGMDKTKAKVGAWRIPEKILFALAILGGSPGVWLGMYVFRHKTKHWYFKFGVPAILLIELVVAFFIFS